MNYTSFEYTKAIYDIEYITGMTLSELRDKLAAGYTLKAPKMQYRLCSECNGTGFVQVAPGARGIKICPVCNSKVRYKTK